MPLRCPACRLSLSVAEVVARASSAPWPEEGVVALLCPGCQAPAHARLRDGLAEVVTRSDGGRYQVLAASAEPELAAVGTAAGLEIWLAGAHRRVARRTTWQAPPSARRARPRSA